MKAFYNDRFFTIGGWFTWVMAGVTVVTAVGGAVAANQQQKKAQKSAESLQGKQMEQMRNGPVFRPPTLPQYIPLDFNKTQKGAIEQDTQYYQRSDADFKRRHLPIHQAEKIFEGRVLADQRGESELMPQIQGEFMRAGITGALESFGDTGGAMNLAPGSAGEASVARNLGLGVMAFQDRNRANRERSLSLAEDLFPRRTFGLSGSDYAAHQANEVGNLNAFNSANYEREFMARQAEVGQEVQRNNAIMQSENAMAQAKAEAEAARMQAIIGAATTAIQAGAKAYGSQAGGGTSVSGAVRPTKARYPGSTTWVPVGQYA